MKQNDYIILAGGCFWGLEDLLLKFEGVSECLVGYTGGNVENPNYSIVKSGNSGHAESVKVNYDKKIIELEKILHFFFKIHDPTSVNQQGNDIGTQYRSTIFYRSKEQKSICEKVIYEVNQSNFWPSPVVTTLEEEKKFYPAEEFHQKYLQRNPGGYTCHYLRK